MNECNFPGIKEYPPQFIDNDERSIYQYPIIMKYLQKKVKGWNFWDFFKTYKDKKIVIYAVTEFTDLILDDYKMCTNQEYVSCICDRGYTRYRGSYREFEVISIDELINRYQEGEVETILICSIFHENEVYRDLMERGISQNALISINSVIFS